MDFEKYITIEYSVKSDLVNLEENSHRVQT